MGRANSQFFSRKNVLLSFFIFAFALKFYVFAVNDIPKLVKVILGRKLVKRKLGILVN